MQKFSFFVAFVVALFIGCGGGDEAVDAGSAACCAPAAEAPASETAAVSEAAPAEALAEVAPVVESVEPAAVEPAASAVVTESH